VAVKYVRRRTAVVKVAFLVEGDVEKMIIDDLKQKSWFDKFNMEVVGETVNVRGGGNLCPINISVFIDQARTFAPDFIIILTDLECDPCISETRDRLGSCDICFLIVAKRTIESWFLADSLFISGMCKKRVSVEFPEDTEQMPFDALKSLLVEKSGTGPGNKVSFTRKALRLGFSVDNAAGHPNCSSAKYFVQKLEALGRGGIEV